MTFQFQEPGATSGYLLERLLDCAKTATGGGAIVAWATASGAQLLLDDPVSRAMYGRGHFDVIVGTDSITNTAAIEYLKVLDQTHPNLSIRALIHDRHSLFHPKFYWFESAGSLTVFVGSGNLTAGGLKRNWEAFSVNTLEDADERRHFVDVISAWTTQNANLLRNVDDSDVANRAAANDSISLPLLDPVAVESEDQSLLAADRLLIAEIPKSGDRWKQANFDKATYEGFFGAKVGSQRRILLHEVADDGTIGMLESRPSVEVISQNYRFELAGARGQNPASGRPIAVFARTINGDFLYSIFMPNTAGHRSIDQFLTGRSGAPARTMRRTEAVPEDLVRHAPDLGIVKAWTSA